MALALDIKANSAAEPDAETMGAAELEEEDELEEDECMSTTSSRRRRTRRRRVHVDHIFDLKRFI